MAPTPSAVREILTWERFGRATRELAEMVATDGYRPDAVDLSGARVLVADDVADTGATLKLVKDFCADLVAEVRCAVVYEKPHTTVSSEYVWQRTDKWINFPWSTLPPVVTRPGQVLDA